MDWHCLAILGALAILGGLLSYWRVRSLEPQWAWNDVAIQLTVGGRLYEVFVPEIRGVTVSDGHLIFETARGQIPIANRWVIPRAVAMLAAACNLPDAEIQRALGLAGRTELWSGDAGSFRPPQMALHRPAAAAAPPDAGPAR